VRALVTKGQVIGALEIVNKVSAGYFDDDDVDLLTSFAAKQPLPSSGPSLSNKT